MPIVAILGERSNGALAAFACRLAAARQTGLTLAWQVPGRDSGTVDLSEPWQSEDRSDPQLPAWLGDLAGAGCAGLPSFQARRLCSDWAPSELPGLLSGGAELLILEASVYDRDPGFERLDALAMACPCPMLVIRGAPESEPRQILAALAGGSHGKSAVKVLAPLAKAETTDHGASWTAIHVIDPIGEFSHAIGERHLQRALSDAMPHAWVKRVVVDTDAVGAISAAAVDHGLVLVGSAGRVGLSRFLRSRFAKRLERECPVPLAIYRQGLPLHRRLQDRLEAFLTQNVPQLEREERIALVDRLDGGSRANVDFIMLILLSTSIAGLGLLQNSTAVVVGAMLVAPLMTPIVGAGLALTQGNRHLVRHAGKSVGIGFLGALAVGLVLGAIVPTDGLSGEVLARTHPTLLDLAVALVSGVAAAYALARPNLSAALPGVAIAAALVPPVASIGIAAAHGAFGRAIGATLLFGTNVVAIILGSAATLFVLGIRGNKDRRQPWVTPLLSTLLVVLCVFAVPLSTWLMDQVRSERLPQSLVEQISAEGYQIVSQEFGGIPVVELAGTEAPSQDLASAIIDATRAMGYGDCRVRWVQEIRP